MPRILISYRREDSIDATGRIDDRLAAHFGRPSVYRDIDAIPVGADFRQHLRDAVSRCDVMLVVIGDRWLNARHEDGSRRLDDPGDFVRMEIESALERQIPIIPVLVGSASMPRAQDLPPTLRNLIYQNAAEVRSHRDFHHHVDQLIESLERLLAATDGPPPGAAPAAGPARQAAPTGRDQRELVQLLHNRCWVSFDPQDYDPLNARYPDIESIREDLRKTKAAGFGGVVTFSSQQTLAAIPSLAKSEGLSVIMGVWDPLDEQELSSAVQQFESVDAYCIGHNGVDRRYTYWELGEVISRVRETTARPTTTTEVLPFYQDNAQLCGLGDWLFPDVHLLLWDRSTASAAVDVARDVDTALDFLHRVAALAREHHRPAMVKTLLYPWQQAAGASIEAQRRFFASVLHCLHDLQSRPSTPVAVAFHSAFDYGWKVGSALFDAWDAYSGLMESDGTLRPAGREIVERWFRA